MSNRTGGNAAHHVRQNHGVIKFNKQKQDFFYGNPIYHTELAWQFAQPNKINPIFYGKRDIYIIPYKASGYAGGYGGQLNASDAAFPRRETRVRDATQEEIRNLGWTRFYKEDL